MGADIRATVSAPFSRRKIIRWLREGVWSRPGVSHKNSSLHNTAGILLLSARACSCNVCGLYLNKSNGRPEEDAHVTWCLACFGCKNSCSSAPKGCQVSASNVHQSLSSAFRAGKRLVGFGQFLEGYPSPLSTVASGKAMASRSWSRYNRAVRLLIARLASTTVLTSLHSLPVK